MDGTTVSAIRAANDIRCDTLTLYLVKRRRGRIRIIQERYALGEPGGNDGRGESRYPPRKRMEQSEA
jgi:hypothetical protein